MISEEWKRGKRVEKEERERERGGERERETDRQTDIDKEREKKRERQTDRQIDKERERERKTDRQIDRYFYGDILCNSFNRLLFHESLSSEWSLIFIISVWCFCINFESEKEIDR